MAAKKPDLTVKDGIFWRKFGIQRVNNYEQSNRLAYDHGIA